LVLFQFGIPATVTSSQRAPSKSRRAPRELQENV
jgi:hypothetical protein